MLKVLKLEKISHHPMYDSRWCVQTNQGSIGRIVRLDTETKENLIKLIEQCNDIFEINKLDMSNKILFD